MDVHFQGTYCIDLSSRLSFPHPMGQCWTNVSLSNQATIGRNKKSCGALPIVHPAGHIQAVHEYF